MNQFALAKSWACPCRFWIGFGVLLICLSPAAAQLQVSLAVNRNMFIRYEPVLVSVDITNLSGRPMVLHDSETTPWFSFQIETQDGRPISPRQSLLTGDAIAIGVGETLRRQVNLTPLYAMDDYGRYRIRATVMDGKSGAFFSSSPVNIEMTDGRIIRQEMVGHPEEGTPRQVTLLSHRLPNATALYVRITNPDAGRIYCTYRLGTIVAYGPPSMELDLQNQVHILHMQAPRTFWYSHIGLNGEILERKAFTQTRTKPTLTRVDGQVLVEGGAVIDEESLEAAQQAPAMSDRPVPLPSGRAAPAIPAAEPEAMPAEEPRRGGINLWPFGRRDE